jgi:hypothetical protein
MLNQVTRSRCEYGFANEILHKISHLITSDCCFESLIIQYLLLSYIQIPQVSWKVTTIPGPVRLPGTVQTLSNSVRLLSGTVQALSNSVRLFSGTVQALSNPVRLFSGTVHSFPDPICLIDSRTSPISRRILVPFHGGQPIAKTGFPLAQFCKKNRTSRQH